MKRVFITGMSGTGTSSVIRELVAHGYKAVDLDEPGWSGHEPDGSWVWRENRVQELLATEDTDVLFVSGCTDRQVAFYPQFDEIVLLSAPVEVMLQRIATRSSNHYGKDPGELADVLINLESVEPLLRRGATCEIDSSTPLEQIVDEILQIAGE